MKTAIEEGIMPVAQERRWLIAVGRAVSRFRQRYSIPQPIIGQVIRMSQPRVSACERPDPENPKTFTWLEIHQIEALVKRSGLDPTLAFGEIFRMAAQDMADAKILMMDRFNPGNVTPCVDELVSQGVTPEEAISQDPDISVEFRDAFFVQLKVARGHAKLRAADKWSMPIVVGDDSRARPSRTRRRVQPVTRRVIGGEIRVEGDDAEGSGT